MIQNTLLVNGMEIKLESLMEDLMVISLGLLTVKLLVWLWVLLMVMLWVMLMGI